MPAFVMLKVKKFDLQCPSRICQIKKIFSLCLEGSNNADPSRKRILGKEMKIYFSRRFSSIKYAATLFTLSYPLRSII